MGLEYYDIELLFEKQDMFYERDQNQTLYYLNSLIDCNYQQTMQRIQLEQYRAMQQTPEMLHPELSTVFMLYTRLLLLIGEILYYAGVELNKEWCIYKILDDKTLLIKRNKNETLTFFESQSF